MSSYFEREDELEAIVRGLEMCSTGIDDFPHRHHLVVATWYLNNSTVPEALSKMRNSILNFLKHHGITGKYNETITLFWIIMVENRLKELAAGTSLVGRTNAVIETLGDSRLMFEYYSKELLWSEKAISGWVHPDLKILETGYINR